MTWLRFECCNIVQLLYHIILLLIAFIVYQLDLIVNTKIRPKNSNFPDLHLLIPIYENICLDLPEIIKYIIKFVRFVEFFKPAFAQMDVLRVL